MGAEGPRGQSFSIYVPVYASGPETFSYQWRKDGVELIDDGRIMGAQTVRLSVADGIDEDTGMYDVIVSYLCGVSASAPVSIDVGDFPYCCSFFCAADYNCDGGIRWCGY